MTLVRHHAEQFCLIGLNNKRSPKHFVRFVLLADRLQFSYQLFRRQLCFVSIVVLFVYVIQVRVSSTCTLTHLVFSFVCLSLAHLLGQTSQLGLNGLLKSKH